MNPFCRYDVKLNKYKVRIRMNRKETIAGRYLICLLSAK